MVSKAAPVVASALAALALTAALLRQGPAVAVSQLATTDAAPQEQSTTTNFLSDDALALAGEIASERGMEDLVTVLPGANFVNSFATFSGYLDVSDTKKTFYWFVTARDASKGTGARADVGLRRPRGPARRAPRVPGPEAFHGGDGQQPRLSRERRAAARLRVFFRAALKMAELPDERPVRDDGDGVGVEELVEPVAGLLGAGIKAEHVRAPARRVGARRRPATVFGRVVAQQAGDGRVFVVDASRVRRRQREQERATHGQPITCSPASKVQLARRG